MSKSFDEARRMASDNLAEMEHQYSLMMRMYRNYVKHGAVNAAAEILEEIEALETYIDCEADMYRQAFY